MANDASLRVSTHTQDVENQKLSVLDYCNSQGIAPIEFVEDTTSGRRSWRDREIGRLLETAAAGDVLVAAEVSRLARSTLQVLELLQAAADRAGIYLGQDERGARAPQSSGTSRRSTERPSHEADARRSPRRDRRLLE